MVCITYGTLIFKLDGHVQCTINYNGKLDGQFNLHEFFSLNYMGIFNVQ